MNAIEKIEKEMNEKGFSEIRSGVYLQTMEGILSDKTGWLEEDPAKDTDFSEYPFWATTNDGFLAGFESIEAACEANDVELTKTEITLAEKEGFGQVRYDDDLTMRRLIAEVEQMTQREVEDWPGDYTRELTTEDADEINAWLDSFGLRISVEEVEI